MFQLYLDARILQRTEPLLHCPQNEIRQKALRVFLAVIRPLTSAGIDALRTQPFHSIGLHLATAGWIRGLVQCVEVSTSKALYDEAAMALNCLVCIGARRFWMNHTVIHDAPRVLSNLLMSTTTTDKIRKVARNALDSMCQRMPDAWYALVDMNASYSKIAPGIHGNISPNVLIDESEDVMFGGTLSELDSLMRRLTCYLDFRFPESLNGLSVTDEDEDLASLICLAVIVTKSLLRTIKVLESATDKPKVTLCVEIGLSMIAFIQRALLCCCSESAIKDTQHDVERCLLTRESDPAESSGLVVCLGRLISMTPFLDKEACSVLKLRILECAILLIQVPNGEMVDIVCRAELYQSCVDYMTERAGSMKHSAATKNSSKEDDTSAEVSALIRFWSVMISTKCDRAHQEILRTDVLFNICSGWCAGSASSLVDKSSDNFIQIFAYELLNVTLAQKEDCPILIAEIERIAGSLGIWAIIGGKPNTLKPDLAFYILCIFIRLVPAAMIAYFERENVSISLLQCLQILPPLHATASHLWSRHNHEENKRRIEGKNEMSSNTVAKVSGDWRAQRLKNVGPRILTTETASESYDYTSTKKIRDLTVTASSVVEPSRVASIENLVPPSELTTAIDRMGVLLIGVKAVFDEVAGPSGNIPYEKIPQILVKLRLSGGELISMTRAFENHSQRSAAVEIEFPTFVSLYAQHCGLLQSASVAIAGNVEDLGYWVPSPAGLWTQVTRCYNHAT